ncbi:MAG: hypothetical protein O2877_00710 [bacterium]|nr:hypothetical protein [bacterium]
MSTNENPNNHDLPSTCPPNKPVRQKHFLMRQTDEKWAAMMAEYETKLLAWKRGLNSALTEAALNGNLTAEMIIEAVESEIELVRHKSDHWRDNHPSALWVMKNQELFGSLPPTERTKVILHLTQDKHWDGNIGESMLMRYPEIFHLIEDTSSREMAIKHAIQFFPSYEEWEWLETLAEHHDHALLRKIVYNMVTNLPIHRDGGLQGNPQYASQAITCQHWAIYEGNLDAFLEMVTVLIQRDATLILSYWEMIVIKIGELAGYTQKDGKKMAGLQSCAVDLVDMGLPFHDVADEMHAIQRRNNTRAYKLGMEHAEEIFNLLLDNLTVITDIGVIRHFPLEIKMRILRQVEKNDAWLYLLITLVYKLGENHEHSEELRNMLVNALHATDRPDKFYRKVAAHCPDKKIYNLGHRWYNGFKGTQLDHGDAPARLGLPHGHLPGAQAEDAQLPQAELRRAAGRLLRRGGQADRPQGPAGRLRELLAT